MNVSINHGLCVPYVIRTSPDKGRGLYAESFIPAATIIWRHVAGQYAVFDEQSLKVLLSWLPDSEAVYVLEHIHCMPEFPEYMIWVFDHGELINHSEQANLCTHTRPEFGQVSPPDCADDLSGILRGNYFTLVSARDIQKGEELTLDYNEDPAGPGYYDRLWSHYDITWDWL